nr:MAG TPA: hypothetical protein [Bacteriophage sp.]
MVDKRYNIWWSVYGRNCGLSKRAKRTAGTGRKAPFWDHFTGPDERGASPSVPDALTGVLSHQNILKNKKTLA